MFIITSLHVITVLIVISLYLFIISYCVFLFQSSQNEDCLDVYGFISKWAGDPYNSAHAFM